MEESARRFARKILLLHLFLLGVVIVLVLFAARDVYRKTRDEAIKQATARQSLLATQTARGIEGFYDSILSDLELLGSDDSNGPATRPAERPEEPRPLRFREGRPMGMPMYGPLLWNQLSRRVVQLFVYDKSNQRTVTVGSSDESLHADDIARQTEKWLQQVEKPSISKFIQLPGLGANLVCVPNRLSPKRLLVAVVAVPEIEARFLNKLNEDKATAAFLVDESLTAMAASSPKLVGVKLDSFDDSHISALATDYVQNSRTGSEILDKSYRLGEVKLWPSIVTAMPVAAVNKKWQLFIASPLTEVDRIVKSVFAKAMLWAIFVVISVTAILVSSSIQLIRGRIRTERIRHDILTKELGQARQIQLAWLPEQSRLRGSIDIAAVNTPASHISGDFYNWFELPDQRTVVIIGDVTGHGMSAAFLMATTQLLVRSTMMRLGEANRCLEEVNNQLCSQAFNGQFVTMLLCIFDIERGEVEIATAGHPAPLFNDGAGFRLLEMEPQLVLGVESSIAFPTQRLKLSPTSSLLLYTDGVPDCLSPAGERFKARRLTECLSGPSTEAQHLIDRVIGSIESFRGPRELADDLTLVAIHVQPLSAVE